MDDPDEFNNRDQGDPRTNSSDDSQIRDGNFSPDPGMSDIPQVEEMYSKNKKLNVHVPVINTETLNCLNYQAVDQEITFRDSMREDKQINSA